MRQVIWRNALYICIESRDMLCSESILLFANVWHHVNTKYKHKS